MPKWTVATRQSRCQQCRKQVIELGDDIWLKSAGVAYCRLCGEDAESAEHVPGMQEDALDEFLGKLPDEAKNHPLVSSWRVLARQIDDGDVPPREMTNYTKEIRLSLMQLTDLYPPTEDDDPTDQAQKARERRHREQSGILYPVTRLYEVQFT